MNIRMIGAAVIVAAAIATSALTFPVANSALSMAPEASRIASAPTAIDDSTTSIAAEVHGSIATVFASVEALRAAATVVVVVEALERTDKPYARLAFTQTRVRIVETVKGVLQAGDEVNVMETGGLLPPSTVKVGGDARLQKPVEVALQGVPVLETGGRYLLFLRVFDGPMTTDPAYMPVGEFQGKFRIATDGRIDYHAQPGVLENGGLGFEVPRALDGRAVDAVMAEIRGR